ncbi:alpha/beta hydrolase [Cellulomonas cellasea]|uniref:alpha/beta fold hydrolase n=1 Tax=Cellulomonas cellasea TaxID=43670 RepID=UPI0025A3442A|nr:alpha/beta hydrolase [Cellulomonas cellasea]MDM8085340.1 alpha/beta hydrolase [Cellulomonas cellasea]
MTRPAARSRRRPLTLLAAALATLALLATTAAASAHQRPHPPAAKPTIVLVHGAWADASSWDAVTAQLQREGYTVVAPPNPLRGLSADSAYLSAYLQQRTTGPVLLVAHSYGGAVVTNAATSDPDVVGIVYVNAFAPAEGETLLGLLTSAGPLDIEALFDAVVYPGAPEGDVDLYLKAPVYTNVFAAGVPAKRAAVLAAGQRPITLSAATEPSGVPAWATLPTWYVLGTEDQIILPSLQESMATRAGSTITRVKAGHLTLVTDPGAVTKAVKAAVRATS